MFAFPYYGAKCFSFIFGAKYQVIYNILLVISISIGAVGTLKVVISIFDSAYALMAFPTMISAILLSPRVIKESKKYFTWYHHHRSLNNPKKMKSLLLLASMTLLPDPD